jgi:hypothetical protein
MDAPSISAITSSGRATAIRSITTTAHFGRLWAVHRLIDASGGVPANQRDFRLRLYFNNARSYDNITTTSVNEDMAYFFIHRATGRFRRIIMEVQS